MGVDRVRFLAQVDEVIESFLIGASRVHDEGAINTLDAGQPAGLVVPGEVRPQGAVGLALFLGYLALSWADLRRRFPDDVQRDQLQGAMAAGFAIACVGALFLAEQYYPPLWFLPALGASMARRR